MQSATNDQHGPGFVAISFFCGERAGEGNGEGVLGVGDFEVAGAARVDDAINCIALRVEGYDVACEVVGVVIRVLDQLGGFGERQGDGGVVFEEGFELVTQIII